MYSAYKEIEKIRNDITHFKSNILCESTAVPANVKMDLGSSKKELAKVFTKDTINDYYLKVLELINVICSKCGLFVNKDVNIIDRDGRDTICEFIVDKNPKNRDC